MKKAKMFLRLMVFKSLSIVPTPIWKFLESVSQVEQGKGWDPLSVVPEIRVIRKLIKSLNIEVPVAVDVGANNGEWAISFAQLIKNSRVFTFEPQKKAFEKLTSNTSKFSNIENFNYGLGETDQDAVLFSDFSGSGMASLSKRDITHLGLSFEQKEKISLTSLDLMIKKGKLDRIPNILKIDVEGHELGVLKGAINSLNEIKILQFEFGGTCIDTKVFFKEYWDLLGKYEFEFFRLTPRGLIKVRSYSENDEVFRFTNYFAIKKLIKS